jgi:hypothetical protein
VSAGFTSRNLRPLTRAEEHFDVEIWKNQAHEGIKRRDWYENFNALGSIQCYEELGSF